MMSINKLLSSLVLPAVVVLLFFGGGCRRSGGAYIYLTPERYMPSLPAELRAFQGSPVYLLEVANVAPETERDYYFYGDNEAVVYEASGTLSAFLRDAFAKAFAGLGMAVYLDPPSPLDPNLPELRATIVRWTEGVLHVQVALSKRGLLVYQQEYRIESPPLDTYEEKPLEYAVYHNIDLAVTGMLADQAFQAAFFQ